MQVIIKFNLPEETNELKLALRGNDYWSVLWDLSQLLRDKLKYGHDHKTADEAIEAIQRELFGLIEDSGCPLDDIE